MKRFESAWVGLSAVALAVACSDDVPKSEVTWYRDALPIVEEHCLACHTGGGIGSFAMDTDPADPESYAIIEDVGVYLVEAVEADIMPPWLPDPTCRSYVGDRRLDDEEKRVLRAWYDGGMKRGDPLDAPAPSEPLLLPRVDMTLAAGAYTPASDFRDVQCFVLDPMSTAEMDVVGLRFVPGSQRVHDALVYTVDRAGAEAADEADSAPGFDCNGSLPDAHLVGSWIPDTPPVIYPEGTGVRITPDSVFVLQIYYDLASGAAELDQSQVELAFADSAVARPARLLRVENESFELAPMTRDIMASASLSLTDAGVVWGVAPELHTFGTRAQLSIEGAAGARCLVDLPRYGYAWQELYFVNEEAGVTFEAGDSAELSCVWTNASDSVVGAGSSGTDEACVAHLFTTLP